MPPKIVLSSSISPNADLAAWVRDCLLDGVELIPIGGEGASVLEDEIDALIVGDGSRPDDFIVTTAHDSISEAKELADAWAPEKHGDTGFVSL